MDTTDGNGKASEVEDELTVAVDANDIPFISLKNTCEDTKFDMVFDKILKGFAKKCNLLWMGGREAHKRLHGGVADGSRKSCATVFYKMILWEIILQKLLDVSDRALQEDKATDCGGNGFLDSSLGLLILILITIGVMYKIGLMTTMGIVGLEPLLEVASCEML